MAVESTAGDVRQPESLSQRKRTSFRLGLTQFLSEKAPKVHGQVRSQTLDQEAVTFLAK